MIFFIHFTSYFWKATFKLIRLYVFFPHVCHIGVITFWDFIFYFSAILSKFNNLRIVYHRITTPLQLEYEMFIWNDRRVEIVDTLWEIQYRSIFKYIFMFPLKNPFANCCSMITSFLIDITRYDNYINVHSCAHIHGLSFITFDISFIIVRYLVEEREREMNKMSIIANCSIHDPRQAVVYKIRYIAYVC